MIHCGQEVAWLPWDQVLLYKFTFSKSNHITPAITSTDARLPLSIRTQGVSQLPRGEYQPFYHCCWIAFLMTPVDDHSNLQVSTKRFIVPNVVLTVGNAKIWSTWSLPCRDEVWSMSETGLVDKWLLLGRRMWRWRKALMQPFRWSMFWWKTCWLGARVKGVGREDFFLYHQAKVPSLLSLLGFWKCHSTCPSLGQICTEVRWIEILFTIAQTGKSFGGSKTEWQFSCVPRCGEEVSSNMIYLRGDDPIQIFKLGSNQHLPLLMEEIQHYLGCIKP